MPISTCSYYSTLDGYKNNSKISQRYHSVLLTKSQSLSLTMYTNADWASSIDDKRWISGHYVFMWDSLISWNLGKHKVVFRSSINVEFHALAFDIFELIWIQLITSHTSYVTHCLLWQCKCRLSCQNLCTPFSY